MTSFDLSVIVAVAPDHPDLEPTLSSITRACAGLALEVLIVGEEIGLIPTVPPQIVVRRVPSAPGTLVPVRWGQGIAMAEAPVVACLSTEFTVAATWAAVLLAQLQGTSIGAAGAVALAPGASATTTAMYLLRFAAFLPRPGSAEVVGNIPGDGAVYRRDRILERPDLLAGGFWEVEFHQHWHAGGGTLRFDPAPLTRYHGPTSLTLGTSLRFRHGSEYGSAMVLRQRHSRLRHFLGAPLLPLLLIGRIARRVVASGVRLSVLISALPPLLILTGAWSAGEAVGAVRARGGGG